MGFDVVALGELLVDFTPAGISARQNPFFQANPSGAPCNALAMLAKLGHTAAFVGKVGDDIHGRRLAATLAELGSRTSGLAVSPCFIGLVLIRWHWIRRGPPQTVTQWFHRNPQTIALQRQWEKQTAPYIFK